MSKKLLVVFALIALLILTACGGQLGKNESAPTATPVSENAQAQEEAEQSAAEKVEEEVVQTGVSADLEAVLAARWVNLETLDAVYRNQGHVAWAAGAGFEGQIATVDARQPEEETSPEGRILVSGLQVQAKGLVANYPACFTTDRTVVSTSETRFHRPDSRNNSALYTNNAAYSGPATLWADCSNWGQLWPNGAPVIVDPTSGEVEELDGGAQATITPTEAGSSTGSTASPTAPQAPAVSSCMSIEELLTEVDGTLAQAGLQYDDAGQLAGAQIVFGFSWEVPAGWTVTYNGSVVKTVPVGATATAWSPESCRPLSE